jgi:2,4-dienoyl-CoA reductase-like NADH-dependent reductase (Old Yellow Enzyme family)
MPHVSINEEQQRAASPSQKERIESALFSPLSIGNGRIKLSHRVIMAPMTRNRGVPLYVSKPNRAWAHDELGATYYAQRATPGGLIITEGIYPTVEASASPCVPGLFLAEQVPGWKKVVEAVHAKQSYIYAQLWHAGRSCLPHFTGHPAMCPSATPFEGDQRSRYAAPEDDTGNPGKGEGIKMSDFPPHEMSHEDIRRTIQAYVDAAKRAVNECGFDGVEVHGGNGYLVEQFLSTNINKRTDEYGSTAEGYARFAVELMTALADAVGGENVAIRLSPFGLFLQTHGEQRMEIWSHLCKELKQRIPNMSYIHFIEPRFEQIIDPAAKETYLRSLGNNVSLRPFQEIMKGTPFFVAGGYNDTNVWGLIESGAADAVSIGRYYTSNPDLVERLRNGKKLAKYARDLFYYVPFEERAHGYTDWPAATE